MAGHSGIKGRKLAPSLSSTLTGKYWNDEVRNNEYLAYTIDDGRKVRINFTGKGNTTEVVESFEAEDTHSIEMQQGGWQAILDNFKKYTEAGK